MGMNCIDLVLEKNKWRAAVKAVMKFLFRKIWRVSSLAEDLLPFLEGLYFVD
jgi:hypothetical protein